MRVLRMVLVMAALTAALGVTAQAGDHPLTTVEILRQRAEQPPDAPTADRPGYLDATGGTLLFSMVGADNAACVRGIPDVTGDGLDEIIVGIDESGTDNVFCLSGASSGTADVVWSVQTADGVSGGAPYGDESVVHVGDADGNGYDNVLIGTAWGGRTAYDFDTLDGTIHWRFDTYLTADSGWIYSLDRMSDVTGDGVPETVFGAGSDSNSIYLVDGASAAGGQATVVWRYPAPDGVGSVRNLGDINGDGAADVFAAVWDYGDTFVCLDGGNAPTGGTVLWSYPVSGAHSTGVLPDISGDGVNEALAVIWASDGSSIRCLNGATGGELWRSTTVTAAGMMVDVIEDVNGDDAPDLVVGSWDNAVIVLDGKNGQEIWRTPVGTTNGGDVWTVRGIADLDGDGVNDVIAGSFDLHAYAMSGVDGEVLWSYSTGNRVFSIAPVGDLDGDGGPEVVVGTQDTSSLVVVYVIDGGDGGALFADDFESGTTGAWSVVFP
jgi:outer membrane protein assembly factor BamB